MFISHDTFVIIFSVYLGACVYMCVFLYVCVFLRVCVCVFQLNALIDKGEGLELELQAISNNLICATLLIITLLK